MILPSMMMEVSSGSNQVNLFEVYRRYCDIRSRNELASSREALAELLKSVESRGQTRNSILDDLSKFMLHLDLRDSRQYQCFYDFVFLMCREKGQKNITVSRAITAWRLVLLGRFRLLNQWCDFVEKHQRHNISVDTWQQVLAFSRCVHEDLGGYDPKGAWPVLIDEFVEHMYRITPSNSSSSRSLSCSCSDPEAKTCISDDAFPGLKIFSGSKRKSHAYYGRNVMDSLKSLSVDSLDSEILNSKRSRQDMITDQPTTYLEAKPPGGATDGHIEVVKHGASFCPSNNSACAVEGSLSKGFAGLLSAGSCT